MFLIQLLLPKRDNDKRPIGEALFDQETVPRTSGVCSAVLAAPDPLPFGNASLRVISRGETGSPFWNR